MFGRLAMLALVPMLAVACANGGTEAKEERSAASAPNADLIGVAINAKWDVQRPTVEDLQQLGARWVRTLVYADNHEQVAATLNGYHCLGVRALVLLNQESFASVHNVPTGDDDAEWETYAAVFADEAAAFVKAHASAIDAVEVWNEPDLPTGGNIPPHRFGLLQYKTYPRLKAILGIRPVVQGAVAGPSWPTYLSEAARWMNERGEYYSDGIGVHPYGQRAGGYPSGYGFGELDSVIREAWSRGNEGRMGHARPVWISEFGLPLEAGDASNYLRRAHAIFSDLRSENILERAFWFAWDDTTHYDPASERFGLVEPNGASPRPLRASGVTFAELAGPLAACGTHGSDGSNPPPPEPTPEPAPEPTPQPAPEPAGESPPSPPSCGCRADVDNRCLYGASVEGCPMTAPGGYCDPNGDGDFGDGDWVRGWEEHHAACGS